MRNKKNSQIYPSEFTQNGIRLTNNTDIVNEFNKIFINIGKEIINNIPNISSKTINVHLIGKNDHSMFLEPTDEQEIHNVVVLLKEVKGSS